MLFKCKYVSNVPTVIAIANMSDNITDNASQVSVTDTNGISGSVGATTDMQTLVNTGSQKAMNNLASLVNDATAPRSFAIGEHILRNGQYSRVKQAIAQGGSFSSSNLEDACIGDEISNLNSELTDYKYIRELAYPNGYVADAQEIALNDNPFNYLFVAFIYSNQGSGVRFTTIVSPTLASNHVALTEAYVAGVNTWGVLESTKFTVAGNYGGQHVYLVSIAGICKIA